MIKLVIYDRPSNTAEVIEVTHGELLLGENVVAIVGDPDGIIHSDFTGCEWCRSLRLRVRSRTIPVMPPLVNMTSEDLKALYGQVMGELEKRGLDQ